VVEARYRLGRDRSDFAEFYQEYESAYGFVGMGQAFKTGTWVVTGPIRYTGQAAIRRDIEDLKTAMAGVGVADAFLPVVAPASVVPQRQDEFYKSEEEALFAIADALREEYAAIVDAGLIAQIDDAFLASTYDVMVPPRSLPTTADGRKCASRLNPRAGAFPRSERAITCAGAAGTGRTQTMCRSRISSTWCCA
jgi:hypothetical protein